MFAAANKLARHFTVPIVLSRKTVSGDCSSSIAACVIVNDEGWIATAHHVIETIQAMTQEKASIAAYQRQVADIQANAAVDPKRKRRQIQKLKRPKRDTTEEFSFWVVLPDSRAVVKQWHSAPIVDLAVGRLEYFEPQWVVKYPVFKDAQRSFDTGTSLCKLGFPFHSFVPTWEATSGRFTLPPEAFPMPLFPIEGIFTRTLELDAPGAPFPMRLVETSSPGLRGQSGGPTFDIQGSIWAIQSRTASLPLGFAPKSDAGQTEHQFLNVGMGAHAETVVEFLKQLGVKYQLTDY